MADTVLAGPPPHPSDPEYPRYRLARAMLVTLVEHRVLRGPARLRLAEALADTALAISDEVPAHNTTPGPRGLEHWAALRGGGTHD